MKTHNINGIEYNVLGGITTPQQYDHARSVLIDFLVEYKNMLSKGIDSAYLAFPTANDMINFLSVILVEKSVGMWDMSMKQRISENLSNTMISEPQLREVVEDFFSVNSSWAGLSPILQGLKNKALEMTFGAMMNQMIQSGQSIELSNLSKMVGDFMTIYNSQAMETLNSQKKSMKGKTARTS